MTHDAFDPYAQWLDIAPHEHPIDHYRLLGLPRFESEPQRIRAAADSRMRHVRSFQTGPRGLHTQKLLNELAAAKLKLLDPKTKAEYDESLRRGSSTPSDSLLSDEEVLLPPPATSSAPAAGPFTPSHLRAPQVAPTVQPGGSMGPGPSAAAPDSPGSTPMLVGQTASGVRVQVSQARPQRKQKKRLSATARRRKWRRIAPAVIALVLLLLVVIVAAILWYISPPWVASATALNSATLAARNSPSHHES